MWDRRAQYLENHDGDTITMILDQGFGDTKLVHIRLLGVFAPELKEAGGRDCQEFVKAWFTKHTVSGITPWQFVVITAREKRADREQETLERYVATVTSLDGTENLNLEIANYIRSKGYSGGTGSK